MKKTLLLSTILFSSSFAHASYDLILAVDDGANRISRIDGSSGSFLGSFGINAFGLPDQIAVQPGTSNAYVTDQVRRTVSVWNYSTGLALNEFSIGGSANTSTGIGFLPDGNLIVMSSTTIRKMSPSGASISSISLPGIGYSMAINSLGEIAVFGETFYRKYDSTLWQLAGGTQSEFLYGNGYFKDNDTVVFSNYLSGQIVKYDVSGVGAAQITGVYASGALNTPLGVAPGHGPYFYSAAYLVTQGAPGVVRGSLVSQSFSPTPVYVGSASNAYRGIATVIAPEPSTMIALGAGIFAFARKRRARNGS